MKIENIKDVEDKFNVQARNAIRWFVRIVLSTCIFVAIVLILRHEVWWKIGIFCLYIVYFTYLQIRIYRYDKSSEIPSQIIFQAFNSLITLRLDVQKYGKRFTISYDQVNEKGEAVHMFSYASGVDEQEVRRELYQKTLVSIETFKKTNDKAQSRI